MKTHILIILSFVTCYLSSFSQSATITNIQVSQRIDGSGYVDIFYNLQGTGSGYNISMEASFNNGETFTPVGSTFLSGSVGAVAPGNNLHLIWNGKGSNNNTYSTQTKIRLIANSTPICGQPITDPRDGKTYNTVQIGTQCWMAQNLNVGIKISGTILQTNNGLIEKYCQDNLESNCDIYGGLYTWDEMMGYVTTEGIQGICPTGWHVPTDAEHSTRTTFLGGVAVAGGKLKSTGTLEAGNGLWHTPNTGATNSSGFAAIPGGSKSYTGSFQLVGYHSRSWSSTEIATISAYAQGLRYNANYVDGSYTEKVWALSVRCLQD